MTSTIARQIQSMLKVEPSPSGFRAWFTVRADLSILPDHFKDGAILPGMCLVQAVLLAGATALNQPLLRLKFLKNAKLMHPILPGETVLIDADTSMNTQGQISIKAKIGGDGKRRAEISLVAQTQNSPEAITA